jgi:uncharacterized membrane protein
MLDRQQMLREIMIDAEDELNDEEILHLMLHNKISANTEQETSGQYTLGERASDAIARFVGSWPFILMFVLIVFVWMALNIYMALQAFDPYPFILLNLVLSCVAAIQAPLILMSQNRQESKDRARAENDYKVNLKAELIIQDLHEKISQIIEDQQKLIESLENKSKQNP